MPNNPPEITHSDRISPWEWFKLHLPALLYAWFWFGMFLSGFLAPEDRVRGLESGLVSEGWHLSVLAAVLGTPILIAYWLRMSGRWPGNPEHRQGNHTDSPAS